MAIIPWNPYRELVTMRGDMESFLDNALGAFLPSLTPTSKFVPPMDAVAKGDDILIRIELSGVDVENDLDLTVQNDVLYISGERHMANEYEQGEVYFREIGYGSFSRTFPLPQGVTAEDVEAEYNDGILAVRVRGGARHLSQQGRHIEVKKAAAEGEAGEPLFPQAAMNDEPKASSEGTDPEETAR